MIARNKLLSTVGGALAILFAQGAQATDLTLAADQARIIKLDNPAASVVVGNPFIADITFENDQTVLVFGKGAGVTNLIFMNDAGEAVANYTVSVVGAPGNMVTFSRGASQRTLGCAGRRCDAMLMIGDDAEYFNIVRTQIEDKSALSSEAAAAQNDGS